MEYTHRMKRRATFLSILLCLSLTLEARQDPSVCGSGPVNRQEQLYLHHRNTRAIASGFRTLAATDRTAAAARYALNDQGNIAVLSDADGVIAHAKTFDLQGKTVRFTPDGSQYRYETVATTFDASAVTGGALLSGLGDDDTRAVNLPFPFSYYAKSYTGVSVNSDGNLTFGVGDSSSDARVLGRMVSGPPRISPLFADLDPAQAQDGVRVLSQSSRLVITWSKVPVYQASGLGPFQTFQVALYPSGVIELSYSSVTAPDAIVGITPGNLSGDTNLVSFNGTPTGTFPGTIADRFTSIDQVDIFTAAQKFYLNHDDAYDYLVLYNVAGVQALADAVAYEVTVRNVNRSGYGDVPVDAGAIAGSAERLQAILNMGPLDQYPTDPNSIVAARAVSNDTPLTIIGHETGHLFLAYASIVDEDGNKPMIGRGGVHWSFVFNSEASLLEGNRIRDNGASAQSRFTTIATSQGYSPLDQYLMGFIPKNQVPTTFYVQSASVSAIRPPESNVNFNGDRVDVTADLVEQAMGRRNPDPTVSQRHFRFAFVVITPGGRDPSAAELSQVEGYRSAFETAYQQFSSGNGYADTKIAKAMHVSTFPASGVLLGGTATVTVRLDSAAAAPVDATIATSGLIAAPGTVTIPAGATSASFSISGMSVGVDELILHSSGYADAYSRVQVMPAANVAVRVISGDRQPFTPGQPLPAPVQIKATDVNLLPYPGITLQATVTGNGKVTPASGVTGPDGIVNFTWTPDNGFNQMRVTASTGATASATTLGNPAIAANGLVNGASFQGNPAPGSIATVFGTYLSNGAAGDAQVLINHVPTTLFYSSPTQINFFVPASTTPGPVQLVVSNAVGNSSTFDATIAEYAPGIFFDAGSGYGAVLTSGTGQPTNAAPVPHGGFVEIYATGLGPLTNAGLVFQTVHAFLGSTEIPISYAGKAPGFVGLYQVNAQIPDSIASGTQQLTLEVKGVTSNAVKVQVQ
jgi:uncharacterized protein (TIGR03437 family)